MTTINLKEYLDGEWFIVMENGNIEEDVYLHATGEWKPTATASIDTEETTEGDGWYSTREEGEAALEAHGITEYNVMEGMGWVLERMAQQVMDESKV